MKKFFIVLMFACIIGMIFFTGCKTTEEVSQYTLTVTTTAGVSGTPTAGTYTYNENDSVAYNYTAETGFAGVNVTMDGAPVSPSGTVTVTGNHTLAASAEPYDIRINWAGMVIPDGPYSPAHIELKFTGSKTSGTVKGKIPEKDNLWGTGTWTVEGNQVDFTVVWGNNEITLTATGTFSDENHISGTWTYEEVGWITIDGSFDIERL
jgi:hypothetical protein